MNYQGVQLILSFSYVSLFIFIKTTGLSKSIENVQSTVFILGFFLFKKRKKKS